MSTPPVDLEPDGYCGLNDLLIGDLLLPEEISKKAYIESAALEIDSRIGSLYAVPVVIAPDKVVQYQATISMLKSINARLASGRILMAAAATLELNVVHAYANSLVREAMSDLEDIRERKYILQGADANSNPSETFVATHVYGFTQDPVSAVDKFYDFVDPIGGNPLKGSFMNPIGMPPW